MLIVTIIRIILTLTFFLLIAEGVAAIFILRRFYATYVRKHIELEARVEKIERRMRLSEQDHVL